MRKLHSSLVLNKSGLIIAGSDSGSGAGIQADLKTFMAHNVYACCVITSITAQNTKTISYKKALTSRLVKKQLKSVLSDFNIEYVKVGMLYNLKICKTVYKILHSHTNLKIILDPVMVAKSGAVLLKDNCMEYLIKNILPITYIVTPNIAETKILAKMDKIENISDIKKAAKIIFQYGCKFVLIKGGHLEEDLQAVDILYDGFSFYQIAGKRYNNDFTHGTGCSLSSAITANLINGYEVLDAIKLAKKYVNEGIKQGIRYGHGINPINHNIKISTSNIDEKNESNDSLLES